MWTSLLLNSAFLALAAGVCHNYEKEYYEEIGCKPAKMGPDGCPMSYDCSMIGQRASNKCHYKGTAYDEGFNLERPDNGCLVQCRCTSSNAGDNSKAFNCINVECAELFNGPPPPGCYSTYEHGECCSVGQVCLSDQSPEQKAARPVCDYKSQQFQVGQKFYPEGGSCLRCICQEGFNGTLVEPFCSKISCDLELHYGQNIADGCVPVYFRDDSCCPIGWRCPEKSDAVISLAGIKSNDKAPDSDLQCQFGDVKMQVGDKLNVGSQWTNAECQCRVPPHPVCIEK